MTSDIKQMAKEAGAGVESWLTTPPKAGLFYFTHEQLAKFAGLVAEECAKAVVQIANEDAGAIRAKYPAPALSQK